MEKSTAVKRKIKSFRSRFATERVTSRSGSAWSAGFFYSTSCTVEKLAHPCASPFGFFPPPAPLRKGTQKAEEQQQRQKQQQQQKQKQKQRQHQQQISPGLVFP